MTYDIASTADGNTAWGAAMRTFAGDIDSRASALELPPVNTQTGTSYTLVLTDRGRWVEMNNGAANTLTIPPNSSVAFPIGTYIYVTQLGAGLTSIAAGTGVTIRSRSGALNFGGQYASATLFKRATNEWVITGDLT